MVIDGFKVCSLCKVNKSITEFNKKSSTKDGYQTHCRECNSKQGKKHYSGNKEKVKKKVKERKQKIKPIIREYILNQLKSGCVDCQEKDILVLDFDHLSDKKFSICRMVRDYYSLDSIALEIAKCVVRCANCHRRKTAKDFNWWKNNISID